MTTINPTVIPRATQIPAQADHNPALSHLYDLLDDLWRSYFRYLDAYTGAQQTLQLHMRSAFFSLSRANFNARPGMRHGQDYFHERAVATRRIAVSLEHTEEAGTGFSLAVVEQLPSAAGKSDAVADGEADGEAGGEATASESMAQEQRQQPSPPVTPPSDGATTSSTPSNGSFRTSEKTGEAGSKISKPKLPLESDPLRWYGILVPQELRSAQASFLSALDESVAQAVNASRGMRDTEAEIRKLRKEIRRAASKD